MKQKDRMLHLLQNNANEWIDIWTIITRTHICHYTEIIRLLRKEGYKIENKTEDVEKHGEKVRHSRYRLVDETIKPKTFLERLFG